jgi:hypothetical protein
MQLHLQLVGIERFLIQLHLLQLVLIEFPADLLSLPTIV